MNLDVALAFHSPEWLSLLAATVPTLVMTDSAAVRSVEAGGVISFKHELSRGGAG
jgi:hypothetical protein